MTFLTSVTDHAHGRRREDQDAPAEKSQFPEHHDLLPKEADELGHAARRVGDLLADGDTHTHTRSFIHLRLRGQLWKRKQPPDLHLGMHAAVDGRPPGVGWTACYHLFATRGQKSPLVLVKGLER